MCTDKHDLIEGIELTDDVLEDVNGGLELSDYHKGCIRHFIGMLRAEIENCTLERFIEYLRTESMYCANPDYLEAAIAYAREVW